MENATQTAEKNFLLLPLENRLLYEYSDGHFTTRVYGFIPDTVLELPEGYTHFGVVVEGSIVLKHSERERPLRQGDFFSVIGPAVIKSHGLGMVNSAKDYRGFNAFGGPIEEKGRLRYIDGCTDTLLVPPVRKGDPCLNHLHFPPGIIQTPHTHPSVRTGIVYRGRGECVVPHEETKQVELAPGYAFVIKTGTTHSFNTHGESMDVIAFHPDSDTGMTDEDHPMINRTMVGGVSASDLDRIRTRE